jgi:hypothetical protein
MNGIFDDSKLGKLWLLVSKFRIAQREVEMTKMWKNCVVIQEERRSKTDVCNILGLSNGTCRRILTEYLTLRRIMTIFLPALPKDDQQQPALFRGNAKIAPKDRKFFLGHKRSQDDNLNG